MADTVLDLLRGGNSSVLSLLRDEESDDNREIRERIERENAEWDEQYKAAMAESIAPKTPGAGILLDAGATMQKGIQNVRKLFGSEDAQKNLDRIERDQENIRTAQPAAVFGEPIVQGLSAIASMGVGALPSLGTRAAAATGLGAAEMTAFAPSDADDLPSRAALGGGLGLASELVVPAVSAIRNMRGNQVANVADDVADMASQLPTRAEGQTGIELTRAQRSMNPADLQVQSLMSQLPEGSQTALERLGRQNREAAGAVADVLDKIAGPSDTAATGIRSSANAAIEARQLIREEAASPLYTKAFEAWNGSIDIQDIARNVADMADRFPDGGKINTVLRKIGGNFNPETGVINGGYLKNGSVEDLHNVKMELDAILASNSDAPLDAYTKKLVIGIQKSLVDRIEIFSEPYKAARLEFARLSPAVDELLDGTVGRVAELSDKQLRSAARVIFDPMEGITNPAAMRNAKAAITGVEGGQDSWNSIVRSEMERRLGSLRTKQDNMSEVILEDLPGKMWSAIFGNNQSKNILFAAVDEDAAKALRFLDEALSKASLGRTVGSPTAQRSKIIKDARPLNTLRRFLQPKDLVDELGSEGELRRMALSIFTDDGTDIINKIAEMIKRGEDYGSEYEKLQKLLNGLDQSQGAARSSRSINNTSE